MFCPVTRKLERPTAISVEVSDLRSINQISLLLVNFKFNGRGLDIPGKRCITRDAMQANRKSANGAIEVFDLLPPEPTMRRPTASANRPMLVEDAVFEVITHERPRREFNDNPTPPRQARQFELSRLLAVAGVFVINRVEHMLSRLSPQAFVTLITSLFLIVFWAFGGFNALAAGPASQPLKPFAVEQVFVDERDANGMKLLAVGGVLVNRSGRTLDVPALSVTSEGGELIGTIRPATGRIEAGASVNFAARLKLTGGKSGEISIFPQM
jgi:hypothetical protein